jgi:succinyl-diaminopimelate desuccinylase
MRCGSREAIVAELTTLVRIPSQGGLDGYEPILHAVRGNLRGRQVDAQLLHDADGAPIAVYGAVRGARQGPTYMLNATVDTAPVGDTATWTHDPFSGRIENGWLYGRGSADSKAGIVIFTHVLASLAEEPHRLRGTMSFLFDAEEHSGAFGGIRRFIDARPEAMPRGGVMIGYPGDERIIIGCRGFLRVKLTVHGIAAHSGSSSRPGVNAIGRAARLVQQLESIDLPSDPPGAFRIPPKMTVTEIHGGEGYSSVPDRCAVHVDVRLTPAFTRDDAERMLKVVVGAFDAESPAPATTYDALPGWPAYRLPDDAPVYRALRSAGESVLGRPLPGDVAGPSSIGNFLATVDVQATSGFGVRYRGIHAADECVDIESLEPTYRTYLEAARILLH